MEFVAMFEKIIAKYTGFNYAVSVDNCTNAILISLHLLSMLGKLNPKSTISIPQNTYLSIPMSLKLHGWNIEFKNIKWHGKYQIGDTNVYDAANDFKKKMANEYNDDAIVCVSFQQKKRLNLDQGGAILLNNKKLYDILCRLRHDGRNHNIVHSEEIKNNGKDILLGYHAYMSPETAVRGILLMNQPQLLRQYRQFSYKDYEDISKLNVFCR